MMNKKSQTVPERLDARTRRTQRALGAALVELMLDREFSSITVQDVLDRAGVGRSTFYSHFRNKDDLLLSDAERFLGILQTHFESTAGLGRRVAPLAELLTHVAEYSAFAAALERSGKAEALWALFVGHFARLIERRLAILVPADPPATPGRPAAVASTPAQAALTREMSARVYSAAAISLVQWWLGRGQPMSPGDLDERFHAMVWRGVAATGR